jgi:hypothetical protein
MTLNMEKTTKTLHSDKSTSSHLSHRSSIRNIEREVSTINVNHIPINGFSNKNGEIFNQEVFYQGL